MNFTVMRILHFTDIHGAGNKFRKLAKDLLSADLIVLSGDITHFGSTENCREIIQIIHTYNENILAVSGNCDPEPIEDFLLNERIGIHRKIVLRENIQIAGLGGSLPCPGPTPNEFTEEQAGVWLGEMHKKIDPGVTSILVFHQPPFGSSTDRLINGNHVGSTSVLEFIKKVQPVLCLTGHIHEARGVDTIDKCKVVNGGPFHQGYFAELEITDENAVNVSLRRLT